MGREKHISGRGRRGLTLLKDDQERSLSVLLDKNIDKFYSFLMEFYFCVLVER